MLVASQDTRGLVLEKNVTGRAGRSYHPHKEEEDSASSKKFTGVKGRHTNMLFDNGQMSPIWLQFPGLTEEQIPSDKVPFGVLVIEMEALASVSPVLSIVV